MAEAFVKEKVNPKNYIADLAKKYMIEKSFEKKSKILIVKESEYHQVKRIITKFAQDSYMEFDTLFKLYKLQKYTIDAKYFAGTQYNYQSLVNLKSIIRSSTLDSSIGSRNKTRDLVNKFINDIKDFSKPFSGNLLDSKRKKIDDLINCGSLTKEEIDFIKSDIKPTYIRKKKDRIAKPVIKTEEGEKVMLESNLFMEADNKYDLIAQNYKTNLKALYERLPELKRGTVNSYVSYLKRLDKGNEVSKRCPSSLYKAWLRLGNTEIKPQQEVVKSIDTTYNEINVLEQVQDNKFILVKDSEILVSNSSLNYIRGYKEALTITSLKIYQLVD